MTLQLLGSPRQYPTLVRQADSSNGAPADRRRLISPFVPDVGEDGGQGAVVKCRMSWHHRKYFGFPITFTRHFERTFYPMQNDERKPFLVSNYPFRSTPMGDGQKIHKDVVYEKEKYPEDLTEERIELNAAPATRLHMLDFLKAIADNGRPVADIEEGHISTASCILANISMKVGRPLVYDPARRQITNDPEATKLLQRQYRQPWIHPDVNKI